MALFYLASRAAPSWYFRGGQSDWCCTYSNN